jgi:hypothetical protein
MARKEDSTDGTTSTKREAAQARAEVGGVRSSDDSVPGPASGGFGQLAEERRDATCSAEVKRRQGRGDGPRWLTASDKVRRLQIALYRKAKTVANRNWNSESRMRENRPSGLMRGGKETVIGLASGLSIRRFPPTLHISSTRWRRPGVRCTPI